MSELPPPPRGDRADLLHRIERAAVASNPVTNAIAEVLDLLQSPLERRREEWFTLLWEAIRNLQSQVADLTDESLRDNEQFVTAVLHATQVALRSHQDEKREALRNAVLNVAVGTAPDEDQQLVFLHLIDVFTPWHLRLLRFFQDPRQVGESMGVQYPEWSMGGISNVLEHTYSELRGRREFYDQLVRELHDHGLLGIDGLHVTMTSSGMFAKRTTGLGDQFVSFISAPPPG